MIGYARVAGAIASLAFAFLAGCHREHSSTGNHLVEKQLPVGEEQRTLVVDASSQLREEFNDGACQSIYEQAAADFRGQTLEDWMSQCDELKESLGTWQIFNSPSLERFEFSPNLVVVEGPAVFAKGSKQLGVEWRLDGARARLVRINIDQTGYHWIAIPAYRDRRQLRDPPLKPQPGSDRVGELFGGPLGRYF